MCHLIHSPTDTLCSHTKPAPVLKAYKLELRVAAWICCTWCVHPVPGVQTHHTQYIASYSDMLPQMWVTLHQNARVVLIPACFG